jgi:hypothetical protein
VYRNDIKYKRYRDVDPEKAIWDDDVKMDYHDKDTDSIKYRLEECEREKYETLDISHMNENCFEELFANHTFNRIKNKIHHLFAKECQLVELPDLSTLSSMITLDISKNRIRKMPKLPESIEELIVNDNELTEINNFMPRLKRFNGSNNKIKIFNYQDSQNSLESIYLTNNPIDNVPILNNLYYLNVSSTNIKEIYQMKRLKTLECSKTHITKIPCMNSLECLICNSSKVNDISELKSLQSLEMVNTPIPRVHYMKQLDAITYHHDSNVEISKQYVIKYVRKNRNNIIELKMIHGSGSIPKRE